MENGNGKLPSVYNKGNEKRKFVFLGRQMINGGSTIAVSANVPIYYCSRQQFIPMYMKLFLMVDPVPSFPAL
jgi:hypothetical protein